MTAVKLITLGCPKNQVDSEIMLGLLDQADFQLVDDINHADAVVVNTCGFIESSKEESIDTILHIVELKTSGQLSSLIVTGCLAQRYGDELIKEIPEIDGILGTGNFDQIVPVIQQSLEGQKVGGISQPDFEYHKDLPRICTTPDYTAYVKIAEGCNNRCSYCIIPTLRGSLKSRSLEDIEEEVRLLAKRGVKEIILIAQDTTVYGLDLYGEPRLTKLLERLVKVEGISWIRVMYLYPDYITDELLKLIAQEKKICKYLDLPLQHASDPILKLMNRFTRREKIESIIKKIRDWIPGVVLRTSLIVGFPGETDKDFQQLVDFVQRVKFDRLGVFAYSREEDTPADLLTGHLPPEVITERWNQVMAIQRQIAFQNNQKLIDQVLEVLIEEYYSKDERIALGRTKGDAPEIDNNIYIHDCQGEIGQIIQVKVLDALEYDLIGVEINEFAE